MAEVAIGDRITLSGGYDGYPAWDPERRADKKWAGTVIAFLGPKNKDHDVVVRMDESICGGFDTVVLARRHVGTSWQDEPLVVMVALTREADGPRAWSRCRRTNYVEACAELNRI
jgi:hypothetical protein